MNQITIAKEKIEKQKGVVILPLKEYRELIKRAVPTYYLTGKVAMDLDASVEKGLREHRVGKTIAADSISSALKQYRKRHAH